MDFGKLIDDVCILVTRPKHQAQALCDLIHQQGWKTTLFPTIEITDLTDKRPFIKYVRNVAQFEIAIFVSANAVHKVAPYWPKEFLKLSIFTIGPGTAETLNQYNISVTEMPKIFNSEGLLNLSILQNVVNKNIVIFMGKEGKQLLANVLTQRGAKVTTVFCYERRCPKQRISKPLDVNCIVSTSAESLHNLFIMTNVDVLPWLLKTPLLVINQNMFQIARKFGFQTVIIANDASKQAVLKALQKWYSSKR